MIVISRLALFSAFVSLIAGCGGRTSLGGRPDAATPVRDVGIQPDLFVVPPDGRPRFDRSSTWERPVQPPDFGLPPGCSKKLGTTCAVQSDCCHPLQCIALGTGVSICSKKCTPDDPDTPLVNEDDCPDLTQHTCADTSPPGGSHACLVHCDPVIGKKTCPAGLACHPESNFYARDLNMAVCIFTPCAGGKDCPVRLSQPCGLTSPGPQCTGPGIPASAFCAPDGVGSVTGSCALEGQCDQVSGLCLPHKLGKATATIGQPCKDDRDCGAAMQCEMESVGPVGAHARNGYCTIVGCALSSTLTIRACPPGSTCHHLSPGGRCYKTCDLSKAADCRGHPLDKHGDYECYNWTNLAVGNYTQVATAPTCEPADYPCSYLATGNTDCTILGMQGNPTKMHCRDRSTGTQLPEGTPGGICLDVTASGP